MPKRLRGERFYGRKKMGEFEECLKTGKIRLFPKAKEKVKIEIAAAEEDLKEAEDRLKHEKFKYATIDAYYSLFHSARALLYREGYRERSHYCLKVAIKALHVEKGRLDKEFLEYFDEALGLREAADYQSLYSKEGAERAILGAREFLKKAKEVLKIK